MPPKSNVTESGLHNVTESEFDMITEESISNDTTASPGSVTAEGISRYKLGSGSFIFTFTFVRLIMLMFRLAFFKKV